MSSSGWSRAGIPSAQFWWWMNRNHSARVNSRSKCSSNLSYLDNWLASKYAKQTRLIFIHHFQRTQPQIEQNFKRSIATGLFELLATALKIQLTSTTTIDLRCTRARLQRSHTHKAHTACVCVTQRAIIHIKMSSSVTGSIALAGDISFLRGNSLRNSATRTRKGNKIWEKMASHALLALNVRGQETDRN